LSSRLIVRLIGRNSPTIRKGFITLHIKTILIVVRHLLPDITRLTKLEPPTLNLDYKPIPIEQY